MTLTEAHYNFLIKNKHYLGNVTITQEVRDYFFHIFNTVSGENRKPTGCGRCVLNVKNRLKIEITKYEELHSL